MSGEVPTSNGDLSSLTEFLRNPTLIEPVLGDFTLLFDKLHAKLWQYKKHFIVFLIAVSVTQISARHFWEATPRFSQLLLSPVSSRLVGRSAFSDVWEWRVHGAVDVSN